MSDALKVQAGDWVRFWCDGRLVIGKVEYVKKGPMLSRPAEVYTDAGVTTETDVLEVRHA